MDKKKETYINKGEVIEVSNNKNLTKSSGSVKRELPKYWDKEYIENKMFKISNQKHKILFQFLWMTGCRISEALNVQKKDLDFKNYIIRLKWLKSRKYKYRNIPMHPKLRDILMLYTAGMNKESVLFDISRQWAWKLSQKHFGGNPHMFRHSFAVHWLRSDADIKTLHRILGHSKFQTTREYLKIVPVDQGKELQKIDF